MHEGLAGLTQFFGLLIFTWMAATGSALFFMAGAPETEIWEIVEEVHEVGEALVPLYLVLHIGSVIMHVFEGNPVWKRMWSFGSRAQRESQPSGA